MLIQIDPSSDLPLYEQLIRQMTFLIAQRAYREHELVPSVREVSKSLAVNPNTVVRAYRSLQDGGILVARRGMGMAVAEAGCERAAVIRQGLVSQRIHDTLAELRRSGLSDTEIRNAFLTLLDDGSYHGSADGRAAGQQSTDGASNPLDTRESEETQS